MVDVVVADDSLFMRVQIRDMLEERSHTVVAEAGNGNEAVNAVKTHDPDIVTMDVKMPGMDGIEAVERIMAEHPTPILMLSKYTDEGTDATFDALNAGAIDFFPKPGGEISPNLISYKTELLETVETVASASVPVSTADEKASAASIPASSSTAASSPDAERASSSRPTVTSQPVPVPDTEQLEGHPTLVIASSAGGPPAVERMLSDLPRGLGFRVIVVQHMPATFTARFARRLEQRCALSVRETSMSGRLSPEEVVVTKGGYHLEVTGERGDEIYFELTEGPPVHSVRPAADVTFESIVDVVSGPLIGAVFSGMGGDGSAGLELVTSHGGVAIVQSPESARVDGMPTRAVETGVADEVCPPEEMAAWIVSSVFEEESPNTGEEV